MLSEYECDNIIIGRILLKLIKTYAMKKPETGGDVLLKTRGKAYFSQLAKKRWAKHKVKLELWEKTRKTKKK